MWNPLNKATDPTGTSFLPEDYLDKQTERRTNLIYLTLFSVVIFGVVGAFFVTNRAWSSVKKRQEGINVRYAQAAKDIEQLKLLEGQKSQMLGKAELTTALIEKAPRSVLLAELINRMPERLTLLEFDLDSKRVDGPAAAPPPKAAPKSLAAKPGTAVTPAPPADSGPRPPKYDSILTLVGVAASHNQVAEYVRTLQECPLLEKVELKFSESTTIDDRQLNKFRIESRLRANADARRIEPLTSHRAGAFRATSADVSTEQAQTAADQEKER